MLLIILSMASHSPCRTQGTSLALAVRPSIEARTATSGVLELVPLRNRGTWTSTAPTLPQSTTPIRPPVSPSAVLGRSNCSRQQKPIFRTSWYCVGDRSTVSGGNLAANNTLHGFPLSLPYSGLVGRTSGTTVYRGTYGRFWSAGALSATESRYLFFYGSYVNPEDDGYKTLGFSVRCFGRTILPLQTTAECIIFA